MKAFEVNFDGLVGPTHNYAGMAFGNIASVSNAFKVSNPKAAALQGLQKMRLLMELGIPQAILPPHERPAFGLLRNLGFQGTETEMLKQVYTEAPKLFRAVYSASSMWVANAATVCPSMDSHDGRVHITPANLINHLHRSLEANMNHRVLKRIFSDEQHFTVHNPLFPHLDFADEGAANHNRFCSDYGSSGIQLFIYGRSAENKKDQTQLPQYYPARQTLEASCAVGRLHQVAQDKVLFVKQNPQIIDQGVFHNDVIAVANQTVFLYHETAFEDTHSVLQLIKKRTPYPLYFIPVSERELSVEEAVKSYIFNSQLVTLPSGGMALIAPEESQESSAANQVLLRIIEQDNPIEALHFVDCRQSMQNGGGPACLRLRIVLTETELKACHPNIFLDEPLYQRLVGWVQKQYRDRVAVEDLLDPNLVQESRTALDELTNILKLGSLYDFQNG